MASRQPGMGGGQPGGGSGGPGAGNRPGGPAAQQGQPGGARPTGPGGRAFGHGRRIEKAKDVKGTTRRMLAYLMPYKWALIAVVVLVTMGSLLNLAAPALLGMAIDQAIELSDRGALGRITLALLGCYLGAWITTAIQGRILAVVTQQAMRKMRNDLFGHVQTLSLSFFDRNPHGELMSRLTNDVDAINRVLSMQITQLFSGLFQLVGILVMMFALNFWLALASMIVFPIMMGMVAVVGKRTRGGFRSLQQRMGAMNGELEETYSGQRVIMAFGQEQAVLDRFDKANAAVREAGTHAQTYAMLVPPLVGILSNANIAIVAGLGGYMVLQGTATVGTIATFISYSRNFANPLRQLGDLYNQIQSAIAGAERIFAILDEQPELTDAEDAVSLGEVQGDVCFDNVDFGYVQNVPVIKEMDFCAKPGQTIALVGPTGAGKTTIINLLTRFYDIDDGVIRIDEHDIRHVYKADLRRKLGIVLQDSFLFADTVMANIRYGRLDATDEECIAAAKLANADHFVRRLPEGYETELSERASNLSQGQRQLLAIARAVLADPAILILDEATSSVDTRTEVHIQEALLRLMEGRTSFVIAHRLSTIRDADNILVINDGRIIEQGNHQDLLDQQGFYANMYLSQFKGQVANPA